MRIIIVGVGDIGLAVAKDLTRHGSNEVVLIDKDPQKCEHLAESDLDVLVIEGDGTDPEILKKAQIERTDALIATTDGDAINTVTAMLAKRLGVPKTIVKLRGLGLRPACREIGVSRIIAPNIAAAAEIMATVFGIERLDFSIVTRGGLRVVDVPAGRAGGLRIEEIDWPSEAHVIAILRGEDVLLAHHNTLVEDGDTLVAIVEGERGLVRLQETVQS